MIVRKCNIAHMGYPNNCPRTTCQIRLQPVLTFRWPTKLVFAVRTDLVFLNFSLEGLTFQLHDKGARVAVNCQSSESFRSGTYAIDINQHVLRGSQSHHFYQLASLQNHSEVERMHQLSISMCSGEATATISINQLASQLEVTAVQPLVQFHSVCFGMMVAILVFRRSCLEILQSMVYAAKQANLFCTLEPNECNKVLQLNF